MLIVKKFLTIKH